MTVLYETEKGILFPGERNLEELQKFIAECYEEYRGKMFTISVKIVYADGGDNEIIEC